MKDQDRTLKIPDRTLALLTKDPGLHGAVNGTLDNLWDWLSANRLDFFPEFTDHGPNHIESIMRGAEALVADESWQFLTPTDAAVLILASVFHDCAMHLSKDGFVTLISIDNAWHAKGRWFLDRFEDPPWPDLWEGFFREARRFDERQLLNILGCAEPVRPLPDDPLHWTELDCRLIGEFVRRHHARLGHEIAVAGVPGPSDEFLITYSQKFEHWPELPDLAGFVARSHNLDMRWCVEQLRKYHGTRVWRHVHATFLMALLRIADYLEINASRAPIDLQSIRRLRSPFSTDEWMMHYPVRDIRVYEDDSEAYMIDVEPKNVKKIRTYLGLNRLFSGIQRELDHSWAVLGEVYGRPKHSQDRDEQFGLRIRRIRTSLDDREEFASDLDFIPVHAAFRTKGDEVLKLMVHPLYDNDPAYAIRELTQNAIDACRERKDFEDQHRDIALDFPDIDSDVRITLKRDKDGDLWLTIEDQGIGMNEDVIVNYFLTAGASFRNSDAWHRLHGGEQGEARVVRSGRFGVGALTVFLLGDRVDVSTRHASERHRNRGIKFTCKLEDPEIELHWCDHNVGTKIRIRVTDEKVIELLSRTSLWTSWDWYRLRWPSLQQDIDLPTTRESIVVTGESIPHDADPLPQDWRRISHPDFSDILCNWFWDQHAACNGILIKEAARVRVHKYHLWPPAGTANESTPFFLLRPPISIMDPDAQLPLNLRRTELTDRLPFEKELLQFVCRDILGFILSRLSDIGQKGQNCRGEFLSLFCKHRNNMALAHPGISVRAKVGGTRRPGHSIDGFWMVMTADGLAIAESPMIARLEARGVCFLPTCLDFTNISLLGAIPSDLVIAPQYVLPGSGFSLLGYCRTALHDPRYPDRFGLERLHEDFGGAALVAETRSRAVLAKGPNEIAENLEAGVHSEVTSSWSLHWVGDDPRGDLDFQELGELMAQASEGSCLALRLFNGSVKPTTPLSPLAKHWDEVFGVTTIPLDATERQSQLSHAYRTLAEEIAYWQERPVSTIRSHRESYDD
jgi:molecular chaperone HtpG